MKKWRNPELMVLGAEKTESIEDLGIGNQERPIWCQCEALGPGKHPHGTPGQENGNKCPCCEGAYKPETLPDDYPVPS